MSDAKENADLLEDLAELQVTLLDFEKRVSEVEHWPAYRDIRDASRSVAHAKAKLLESLGRKMNAGKMMRENKQKYPERYCAHPQCMWRVTSGPCPKHGERGNAVRRETTTVSGEHGAAEQAATASLCPKCEGSLVHCRECQRCCWSLQRGLCGRCDVAF